jgi:hypothetical protein
VPAHRQPDRPWFARPGAIAAGLSLLAHGLLLGLAMLLPASIPTPKSRMFEIDAYLLDDEPGPGPDARAEEPAEQRTDVFRFAGNDPEPEESRAGLQAPATLTSPEGDPRPGGEGGGGEGNDRQGRGGGGFFAAADRARAVVYAIDRSISMGLRGSLDDAKRELLDSLERLPPDARFQVLLYNREARPLTVAGRSGLLPAGEAVRRAVAEAVSEVRAEGSTNHVAALREALALAPELLYLVTDADDLTLAEVREITRINRGRVVIHTVDLGVGHRPASEGALRALAAANRGTYRAVSPPGPR